MALASLGGLLAGVAAAHDKASESRDALGNAVNLAEDAQALLATALAGGTTDDQVAVLATFREVVDGINALSRLLGNAMDHAQTLLGSLREADAALPRVPPVTPPVVPTLPTAPAGQSLITTAPPTAPLSPLSPERVGELRRDLPPTVVGGTGRKTHGRWVALDGSTQREISGRDEWTPKVNAALAAEGCPRLPVVTETDVELKLAARMREQGPADPAMRHLTLALNYAPCEGPFGCDSLLPAVLPDGYTLTVHGPDGYYKKFTGGQPPWRR